MGVKATKYDEIVAGNRVPSGKRLQKTMEIHHFSWGNQRKWQFSIVFCMFARVSQTYCGL